jgi:N-acetylneuraminate synthase/N,N'-diacetyllegionaminate synthase
MTSITIDGRAIGPGHPCYVIAEIGFNHEGKVDLALEMIEAAAAAGVDAVKFQTYKAAGLTLESHEHFELIKHGELDLAAHKTLAAKAKSCGVTFLSTPFDDWSIDVLEEVGVPAYKVASMDLTNLPMLRRLARIGKPIILSTGMGTMAEIGEAVDTVFAEGNRQLVLLHCTSHYPPEPSNAHLRTMQQIAEGFGLATGYSDHVLGNAVAVASVAMGACVIEKHFTTDKNLPGPDHKISADTADMTALVREVRMVEAALGRRCADITRPDRPQAALARRGIFAAGDIPAGTTITADMLKIVRPERGLAPKMIDTVVGRTARVAIRREQTVDWDKV